MYPVNSVQNLKFKYSFHKLILNLEKKIKVHYLETPVYTLRVLG